ncbi:MAG: NBR1-Ig-like domain-containing protein [Anaerolineales bacterium]|nr:NBR1-Ig-like domain-containing protein [Anaerolineales bacterium]
MKYKRSCMSALIALVLAALACNAPQRAAAPQVAEIVAQTQTAVAVEQLLTATTPASATPTTPTMPTEQAVTPTVSPKQCTNKARFVNETVPDGTQFPPGQAFVKTWTLQNVGDCTWTPEYSLVFVRGEQMSGTSPAPIGQNVPPQGMIQIYLPQTAPMEPGEHQGYWKLRDPSGEEFGLGDDASVAFWVKINVIAGAPTSATPGALNLGAPTRTITFSNNRVPFSLGDDDDIGFAVKDNQLILTAFRPAGDLWRVAEIGQLSNFAIEARFRTGSACSGSDAYGLIVRAPSQPDNIIDSGMVFGFSCEGKYRIYRMDNGGYTGIMRWSAHAALRAGANQDNAILIQAQGERYQLYINGMLVYEFSDPSYSTGLFGLMISSGGTPNFRVAVSQIAIWDLP